jgi:predicted O-linked N-acetylglucosamine transferase (SPINDLY family)
MTTTKHLAMRAEDTFRQALRLHQQSLLEDAQRLYRQTLDIEPAHFPTLHMLGAVALQKRQPNLALEWIAKALTIEPGNAAVHVNHGTALHQLGRFEDAVTSCDRAISRKSDCLEAHYNRGNALRELARYAEAIASYDTAIALKPDYAEAHINRGLALSALRRRHEAIESFDRASAANPNNADAHFNRGNEWQSLGQHQAAVACYDRALALQPGFADAHINRGNALVSLRRYSAALAAFDKAVALSPGHAQAHLNRAAALQHLGDHARAVASYDTAIAIQPDYADAHANRGRALRELKRYDASIESYGKAIAFAKDSAAMRADRRHIKMQLCDWQDFDADLAQIEADVSRDSPAANPFYLLALSDSATLQRRAAEKWVRQKCPAIDSGGDVPKRDPSVPIHIGYFSADYHEHATAYLIAQLFELHDRSRFRISAFSFGPDSAGPMRRRLRAACDEFIDVRHLSDIETVSLARNRRIDIAVDLKGFTMDNRTGIFARRAAPVQVNYLGFPGTMAAPYIDYLIADRILIPAENERHFAEKVVCLPNSYQVNDATREIADKVFTRTELGLPSSGFVFCCFNNTYKILPAVFDRWMRVLTRVESSVLWLLGDNPTAMRNLRREAALRDVSPDRLVFADRIDLRQHLARHRAADLFLDTLPCNAHTTASDALWAGLPVLTCPGESFAARVAASLLTAIGLPELIAANLDRYEELAVHLATNRQALHQLRRRLHENRLTAPLFDSLRYCRDLEAAFAGMVQRRFNHAMTER